MKPLYLASLLFVFFIASCADVRNKTDLREMKLNGRVKSIKESSYKAEDKFGQITKGDKTRYRDIATGRDFNSFIQFREDGNKSEANFYDSDDDLRTKIVYKYSGSNRKTEESEYDSDGDLERKTIHSYDSKGKQTESVNYNSDGKMSSKTIYNYSEGGLLQDENFYDDDGKLRYKIEYAYDKKGSKTEEKATSLYGSFEYVFIYKFDNLPQLKFNIALLLRL